MNNEKLFFNKVNAGVRGKSILGFNCPTSHILMEFRGRTAIILSRFLCSRYRMSSYDGGRLSFTSSSFKRLSNSGKRKVKINVAAASTTKHHHLMQNSFVKTCVEFGKHGSHYTETGARNSAAQSFFVFILIPTTRQNRSVNFFRSSQSYSDHLHEYYFLAFQECYAIRWNQQHFLDQSHFVNLIIQCIIFSLNCVNWIAALSDLSRLWSRSDTKRRYK